MASHYSAWQLYDRAGQRWFNLAEAAISATETSLPLPKVDPLPNLRVVPYLSSAVALGVWLTEARAAGVPFRALPAELGLKDIDPVIRVVCPFRDMLDNLRQQKSGPAPQQQQS